MERCGVSLSICVCTTWAVAFGGLAVLVNGQTAVWFIWPGLLQCRARYVGV